MIGVVRVCCVLLLAGGCERVFPLEYDLPEPCGSDSRYEPISGVPMVDETHRYRYIADGKHWLFAERTCESEGAHLAVPEAFDELRALQDQMPLHGLDFAWVGVVRDVDAPDPRDPASFRFITGESVPFGLWRGGEPSNAPGTFPEIVGELRNFDPTNSGGLNDKNPTEPDKYICECDRLELAAFDVPE